MVGPQSEAVEFDVHMVVDQETEMEGWIHGVYNRQRPLSSDLLLPTRLYFPKSKQPSETV